jgi:protein TonB
MVLLLVSFTWETPRMSINLIESELRSQKSLRSTFVSVAVHACLITFAVYATASAGEAIVKSPSDPVTIFYPPTPRKPADPARTSTKGSAGGIAVPRTVNRKPIDLTHIPTELPTIDASTPAIDVSTLFGPATPTASGGAHDGTGDDGAPMFAAPVEKPAIPRSGNPSPKYPSLLESSRVEGAVLVQFVVDTLGVADMSSFKVLDATNELFAESTRATLTKWRFYPAEAGGRKVKQIVQLPLKFVAPHK